MGLKSLRKQLETEAAKRAEREANGGTFKKAVRDYELLKDSDTITFRIMQELDEDAENYDVDRGTGLITPIHQTAFGVKPFRSARCTKETEGSCYGCERYADRSDEKSKDWRPRTMVYFNALASVNGEFVPFLFSQRDRSALVDFLLEYSNDMNTITDVVLKLKKSGTGTDTKYTVMQLRTKPEEFPIGEHEIFPVEQAVASIEYSKQADWFAGGNGVAEEKTESKPATPAVAKSTTTDDEEW